MVCSLEPQMAGHFPPTFPTNPRHALWNDLLNVYQDDGGIWNFDDAESTNPFMIRVTYVYRSFGTDDTILETPMRITQELTCHQAWDIHRNIHEPMPENLGRRRVGGIGRLYRRQFSLFYRHVME